MAPKCAREARRKRRPPLLCCLCLAALGCSWLLFIDKRAALTPSLASAAAQEPGAGPRMLPGWAFGRAPTRELLLGGPGVVQPAPSASQPESSRPQLASGWIRILTATGSEPVSDAFVELGFCALDASHEVLEVLRSDAEGRVHCSYPAGELRVVAWDQSRAVGPLFVDIQPGVGFEHSLRLEPTQAVQGRVLDAHSGLPVVGARIAFRTFSECDQVESGPDGWFEHPRFPASGMAEQVHVSAVGYGPSVRYLTIDERGRWELPACETRGQGSSGDRQQFIELNLVPELRLSGKILDAEGLPVVGAEVLCEGFFRMLPDVASRDTQSQLSDASGAFELRGLRSDISHGLLISAPGYAELCLEIPIGQRLENEHLRLVLSPESLLAGTIIDSDGMPVEDLQVDLIRLQPSPPSAASSEPESAGKDLRLRIAGHQREARSDSMGCFVFERTQPGAYRLEISRAGRVWITTELGAEAIGSGQALQLQLPGQASTLRGQVLHAAEATRLEVWREGLVASVSLDSGGVFRVAGLDLEGPYELLVSGQGWDPAGVLQAWGATGSAWAHEMPVLEMQLQAPSSELVLAKAASK